MYPVSAEYRAKILSPDVRQRRIRGQIGSVSFTEVDILKDSLSYMNQMAKGADISLGGVFVGTLKMTFLRSFSDRIERKTWRGKTLSVSVGLLIDEDESIWEDVPLGVFEIDDAEHTSTGVDVIAYDRMPRFDKNLSINESAGYPFDYLNYCCRQCQVPMGMTRAEVEALANGDRYVSIYPDNDMTTYRDMVSYIAALLGGYATMDRQGRLVVRSFKTTTDLTVNRNQRADGGRWCDFDTTYTGVSVVRIEDQYVRYYGEQSGLTMKLGSNPFLQYGGDTIIQEMCEEIVEALENFDYTPFTCSSFLDPAIDLGDIVDYTQGLAGVLSKGMVMKISYTFNRGVKLEGFGKNPALFGAQSKTDKNIAGLNSRTGSEKDKITIVSFANVAPIGIDDTWHQIAHMRIGVMESQLVQMNGVVRLNMSEAGTVYVRYVLNGDYLPFIHVCQFPVGLNTITLFLPLAVTNEYVNDFKAEIQSPDGVGIVAVDNAKITLQGVGVTTGNWDGFIEVEDSYVFRFQQGLGFGYTDRAETRMLSSALTEPLTDSFSFGFGEGIAFVYSETTNTRLTMETVVMKITTQDGEYLQTQDGQNLIL